MNRLQTALAYARHWYMRLTRIDWFHRLMKISDECGRVVSLQSGYAGAGVRYAWRWYPLPIIVLYFYEGSEPIYPMTYRGYPVVCDWAIPIDPAPLD